jgi:SAM-dependent methyltransferase
LISGAPVSGTRALVQRTQRQAIYKAASVLLPDHSGGSDRSCPFLNLAFNESLHVVRRPALGRDNGRAHFVEPLLHGGSVHSRDGSIVELLNNRRGVVAIDIDTRFLDGIAVDNLQVLKLDVVDEPLPSGDFDLIHSRAVLTHLGARDVVLDKMIRALRPGGWLLLEEADGFPLTASGSEFFIKMMTPMVREWTGARKLPSLFAGHGLLHIGADVRTGSLTAAHPLPSFGASESRARVTCGSGQVPPTKA